MKLVYTPNADIEFQFTCEPDTPSSKAAIDAIRHWTDVAELVTFAETRQGYENSDGFFGITYPSDFDEFDRANGFSIPEGYVEAKAWYGSHDGKIYQLPETDYLQLLGQFLILNNHLELASRVGKLL